MVRWQRWYHQYTVMETGNTDFCHNLKKHTYCSKQLLNIALQRKEDGCLHCEEPAPRSRQRTAPTAGNLCDPAMIPHPTPSCPGICHILCLQWKTRGCKWRGKKRKWKTHSTKKATTIQHTEMRFAALTLLIPDWHEHISNWLSF